MNPSSVRTHTRGQIRFTLIAMSCVCGVAAAQWQGPFAPNQRMVYNNGPVFVGPGSLGTTLFDVQENAAGSRVIGLHAFVGTPTNGARTTALWGETNNPKGRALQGFNFATTASGDSNNPAVGIWAETASPTGQGLRARATATTGSSFAAYFDNASTSATAVFADATSSSGTTRGVWGNVESPNGFAGYFTGGRSYFEGKVGIGWNLPSDYMVQVATNFDTELALTSGPAIGGSIPSRTWSLQSSNVDIPDTNPLCGSFQIIDRTGGLPRLLITTAGQVCMGTNTPSGNSKLTVSGNISGTTIDAALKNFKIDHPTDPDNKYLFHASIESSEMLNLYTGHTQTGPDGYAVVTLPPWFEALNTDFRYQLTVVDESDAGWILAKVVAKIRDGQFTIRTSSPNTEVSWQVTGVRQDAWAQKNPMKVERDKEPQNRGRMLYPEAYGLPASRGIMAPAEPAPPAKVVLPKQTTRQPSIAGSNSGPGSGPGSGPAPLVPAINGGR